MSLRQKNLRRDLLEKGLVELQWRAIAMSFWAFCAHVKVISKRDPRGWEPLRMWEHQRDFAAHLFAGEHVVLLKARQLGATAITLVYALWLMLTKPGGATIVMLSKDRDAANEAIDKLTFMYDRLPDWLRTRGPDVAERAKTHFSLVFSDGSRSSIQSLPATSSAGAGGTNDLVILDELGLADRAADIVRTVEASAEAGQVVALSTSRGNNFFAFLWREAHRGAKSYTALFYPWYFSELMSRKDYEERKSFWQRRGEPHRFYQEHPASPEEAFQESAQRRFHHLPPIEECEDFPLAGSLVEAGGGQVSLVPAEDDVSGSALRLSVALPNPQLDYVIGADPSQGRGKDYSVAQVVAPTERGCEVVAYFRDNRLEPAEFARELDKLGRFFSGRNGPALIGVEDQGGQGQLPNHVLGHELRYPRLWRDQATGKRVQQVSDSFGFKMHKGRKPVVVGRLAEWLASGRVAGLHSLLREELGAFVVKETAAGNQTVAAEDGMHDDFVMSLAIGVALLVQAEIRAEPPRAAAKGEEGEAVLSVGDIKEEMRRHQHLEQQRKKRRVRLGGVRIGARR